MERSRSSGHLVGSVVLLILLQAGICVAQNCGCASGLCCSKFGYCGNGNPYCGNGCQSGPCYNHSDGGGSNDENDGSIELQLLIVVQAGISGNVASIVTQSFFDDLLAGVASSCEGKGFYSRDAFVTAANAFTGFGTTGSADVRKRDIAAFFAHVLHETVGFCYINEINPGSAYCHASAEWPCADGKSYHGRGPLQLSWNYNYGAAGKSIGFDGINNPERVAQDAMVSFKTATWFWMNNCHNAITSGHGFGATIRAINSMECNGGNPAGVSSRVDYYNKLCSQMGVDPGPNVSC